MLPTLNTWGSTCPSRNMVIMLIGNKCDLDRREVSFEEGAWFARQSLGCGAPCTPTGCDPLKR